MIKCKCINEFIKDLKTEDTSYLNPFKWDLYKYIKSMWCCQSKTSIELDNIKREINEIKKIQGYNINPLFDKDVNLSDDKQMINIDITSDEIKTTIIELKDEIHELNEKINNIELSVNNSIGTDAFCIIETNTTYLI